MGCPEINPFNLPKAIKLPLRVMDPIMTDSIMVISVVVVLLAVPFAILIISADATNADAPPPNPLKIPTISGMAVMATRRAEITPITVPMAKPIIMLFKLLLAPDTVTVASVF